MKIFFTILVLLSAITHFYIFYLEILHYGSDKFCQTFKIDNPQHIDILRPTFNNLGIYNLALAISLCLGLFIYLFFHNPTAHGFSYGMLFTALGSICGVGIYLFKTTSNNHRAALIQTIPAILAIICLPFL